MEVSVLVNTTVVIPDRPTNRAANALDPPFPKRRRR
jgi:hypothetical protein